MKKYSQDRGIADALLAAIIVAKPPQTQSGTAVGWP